MLCPVQSIVESSSLNTESSTDQNSSGVTSRKLSLIEETRTTASHFYTIGHCGPISGKTVEVRTVVSVANSEKRTIECTHADGNFDVTQCALRTDIRNTDYGAGCFDEFVPAVRVSFLRFALSDWKSWIAKDP